MLGWYVVHTCHTVKFFMFLFWVPLLLHCWQRDFAAYSYLCIISENALGSDFYWRAGAHLLLPLPGVVRGGILDRFRTQIFVNCGNTHDWSSGISIVYGYRLRIGHSHSQQFPTMQIFTGISRNTQSKLYMLSLTECVWGFQNNALWDTQNKTKPVSHSL